MTKKNDTAPKAAQPKAPEEAGNPTPAKTEKKPKKAELPGFLNGYIKAYPAEKVFHVTSDRQVFLGKDYSLAKAHQNGLGQGEITTYNL